MSPTPPSRFPVCVAVAACAIAGCAIAVCAFAACAAAGPAERIGCAEWHADVALPGGVVVVHSGSAKVLDGRPTGTPWIRKLGGAVAVPTEWACATTGDIARAVGEIAGDEAGIEVTVTISRELSPVCDGAGALLVERLTLEAEATTTTPFDVGVPLVRLPRSRLGSVFLPRKDGVGYEVPAARLRCGAYVIGGEDPIGGCQPLALPLVDLEIGGGRRLGLFTDPGFTSVFHFEPVGDDVVVSGLWRYPNQRVPFARHERWLGTRVHSEPPWTTLDEFHRRFAVVPGPKWLDDISVVYFDYLGERGKGWFRDLDALADRIPVARRGAVAVALHGWYDRLGEYAYDHERDRFRDRWRALKKRDGGVRMSVDEVRRRLQYARELGFRVLLYFADGMIIDSASERGRRVSRELGTSGWNGPEVEGSLLVQNPADPEVRAWFKAYLRALLRSFGDLLDGLVWDETFWIKRHMIATSPTPAYADVAMLSLVRQLTRVVEQHRAGIAFLTADTIGVHGYDPPAYAMMSHGTFQDSECVPAAWSYGLFGNWKKPLWSVLWGARTHFDEMSLGVLKYGAPVSLANGWADDWGPAEMSDAALDRALELKAFLEAPRMVPIRPAFLSESPQEFLDRPLPGALEVDCFRVAGPYPNTRERGFETMYPPEHGEPVEWRPLAASAGGYIDFARAFGDGALVAYAEAAVIAPRAISVDLAVGADDGIKVWLNGVEVVSDHHHRRHRFGDLVARDVLFESGANRILVKVENATGEWGFSLRVRDEGLRPLACREPSTETSGPAALPPAGGGPPQR